MSIHIADRKSLPGRISYVLIDSHLLRSLLVLEYLHYLLPTISSWQFMMSCQSSDSKSNMYWREPLEYSKKQSDSRDCMPRSTSSLQALQSCHFLQRGLDGFQIFQVIPSPFWFSESQGFPSTMVLSIHLDRLWWWTQVLQVERIMHNILKLSSGSSFLHS